MHNNGRRGDDGSVELTTESFSRKSCGTGRVELHQVKETYIQIHLQTTFLILLTPKNLHHKLAVNTVVHDVNFFLPAFLHFCAYFIIDC